MRVWSPIISVVLGFAVSSGAFADVVHVATRYGTLSIEELPNRVNFEGRVFFKGHRLHPDVHGNNALTVARIFRLTNADAVLFEDRGGVGCPYLWYIVSVAPLGVASTREFGSCGPLLDWAQKGQAIVIHTTGFCGPLEPLSERERASKEIHTFSYRRGVVAEIGAHAPCQ